MKGPRGHLLVDTVIVLLGGTLAGAAVYAAVAAQAPEYVVVQPANGYLPPTVIIRANAPGQMQLCAEGRGLAACRNVDDFRQWVSQRK